MSEHQPRPVDESTDRYTDGYADALRDLAINWGTDCDGCAVLLQRLARLDPELRPDDDSEIAR
jgi:hypothetical protein